MPLVELKDPSPLSQRWFGVLAAIFACVVGASLQWRSELQGALAVGAVFGVVLAVIYYAFPASQRPIYRGWMLAVYPIGFVMSYVLLGFIYFIVITPIGLAMRLLGHDPMNRKFEPAADTYWTPHVSSTDPKLYFQQF